MRTIPIIITALLFFTFAVGNAATLIRSDTYFLDSSSIAQIDLDNDSTPDIQIDAFLQTTSLNNDPFVMEMLGDARVAVVGNIAQSFTAGQTLRPLDLTYVTAPSQVLAGGLILDALGNSVMEGWGGCTHDPLGNPICPPSGPINQIELFFVDLGSGVAWVDLDPSFGQLDVHWGYLESPGSEIFLTPVPEPSSFGLLVFASFSLVLRRNR